MVSLEDRINELCKGSTLLSPIWLARLIEEIFETSWIKMGITSPLENNHWPLLGQGVRSQAPHSSWTNVTSRKTESGTVLRFLTPHGTLFSALRQSADAWVSVAFDAKLAQSDSVRIATGIATIMRQPKLAASDMPYRPQRNFDSSANNDQSCMITLPVPHYFLLRLLTYMIMPDVSESLNKMAHDLSSSSSQQVSQKPGFPLPNCVYADLLDSYCDYLLSNARQPPGTTLVSSRSLCADLARLYIQAVADFWLTPFASGMDASSMSFSANVSLPPPVLLQFIRRFLKRYFVNAAEEWCNVPNISQSVRSTSFAALKQPLLAFLVSCATHWPLNTSFGNVVSCWRAVVLPWHAAKRFESTFLPKLVVWEPYVSENLVFYSETILVPLVMHLTRANIACPAYASAVFRLAKVFGGAPDTDALLKLLIRISSSTSNASVCTTPSALPRSTQAQFCFASSGAVVAARQLVEVIDSAIVTPASSCSGSTKEILRNSKLLLADAFRCNLSLEESWANESFNKTPSFFSYEGEKTKESGGRVPKFRHVPHRQLSLSNFSKSSDDLSSSRDFRSSDIPVILRLQYFFGALLLRHGLLPKEGRAAAICQAARFRWIADRREIAFFGGFLLVVYFVFSAPSFIFLGAFFFTIRTFLAYILGQLQKMLHGNGKTENGAPASSPLRYGSNEGTATDTSPASNGSEKNAFD